MVAGQDKKEVRTNRSYGCLLILSLGLVFVAQGQDSVGGWPKHINEVKIDYTKALSSAEKASLIDDLYRNDATIDNNATTKEIWYLAKAYKQSGNKGYLEASFGYADQLLIVSEPQNLWAIEGDDEVKGILSFLQEDKGTVIEPSIELYRDWQGK